MKSYLVLILALLLCSCAKLEKQEAREKAIKLNDYAVEIMHAKPDSALYYLNQAINADSEYYLAHSNKASIFIRKGEYDKAIESMEQAVAIKPELAESVMMLGMLYDFTGRSELANAQYQKAIKIFDARLKMPNKHSLANKTNRAHALLLIGKESEGRKVIQELIKENPEDSILKWMLDFDKDSLFKEFSGTK